MSVYTRGLSVEQKRTALRLACRCGNNGGADCSACLELMSLEEPSCCDDEANHTERETDSGLCPKCHEHADEIACLECGTVIFISTCCG